MSVEKMMMSFDITNAKGIFDPYTHERFVEWREASEEEDRIEIAVRGNANNVLYIEAQKRTHDALISFLATPASVLHGVLLKLKAAAIIEDSISDAINSNNRLVAPRAIAAAINDIENMLFFEIGRIKSEKT